MRSEAGPPAAGKILTHHGAQGACQDLRESHKMSTASNNGCVAGGKLSDIENLSIPDATLLPSSPGVLQARHSLLK